MLNKICYIIQSEEYYFDQMLKWHNKNFCENICIYCKILYQMHKWHDNNFCDITKILYQKMFWSN